MSLHSTCLCRLDSIPQELKERSQWVLWRGEKVPFQVDGQPAKSNDETTWNTFENVAAQFKFGGYDGVGFVFGSNDDFLGIDLDGCRDPESGKVADSAREIVVECNTYSEVSPSGTGIKLFGIGKSPFDKGKKKTLEVEKLGDKTPAIEVYDKGRYFTVTGARLSGLPTLPQNCQEQVNSICQRLWQTNNDKSTAPAVSLQSEILERAANYVAKMPAAISGQHGHDTAFHVACVLVLGFDLTPEQAFPIFNEFNQGCQPPWTDSEIWHKLTDADKQAGERGYLLRGHLTESHQFSRTPQTLEYQRLTSAELDAGDFELDYLVEGVLVDRQPGLIAGPHKSLKTNILVDLAISLARGGHFLGFFNVPRAARVAIMSGESGLATLQETARRIAVAAGCRLREISNLI